MIRKTGYSILIIFLFAFVGFSQGVDPEETNKNKKKSPPKETKPIAPKPKPTKPVATKPTVSKSTTPPKTAKKPKPPPVKLSESKIIWTDNCDPREDSERCQISAREAVTASFYDVIKSVNGKITYKIPASKEELESYSVVIVDFCLDNANEYLINVIKEYIQSGGSAFILGGNSCQSGGHNTSWASQLTKDFGVTFSSDDNYDTLWANAVGSHPTTLKIEKMYFSGNAYLNVSSPSESILTVNNRPIAAVYDGTGAFVALADDVGFGWGPNSWENLGSTDNFRFWQNALAWLIKHSKTKSQKSSSADKSDKNTDSDFSAKLTVSVNQSGVKIFIDDVQYDTEYGNSPFVYDSLAPASYTIRVEKSGYQTQSRTVTLAHKQKLSLRFDLVAAVGGLDISVDNSKATQGKRARIVEGDADSNETKKDANSAALAKQYYDNGSAYLKSGKFDLAITNFTKTIEINPKYEDTYFLLGRAYKENNQYDLAIACFTKAIEYNPNSAWAYSSRAFTNRLIGEVDKSIADATKAIELNPNEGDIYHTRALAYSRKGETDLAISDYTKAIELLPDFYFAYLNRGSSYYDKNDYDRAIADATKAIEIYDKSDDAYELRGRCYFAKKDYDRAIADISKAIEINPKEKVFYINRATAYEALGRNDLAAVDRQKAKKLGGQ